MVDLITGLSGGSFTALACGLYGDKLFIDCEQRFLKRGVQGEIISRVLSPSNWGTLPGTGTSRSGVAAQFYDDVQFRAPPSAICAAPRGRSSWTRPCPSGSSRNSGRRSSRSHRR